MEGSKQQHFIKPRNSRCQEGTPKEKPPCLRAQVTLRPPQDAGQSVRGGLVVKKWPFHSDHSFFSFTISSPPFPVSVVTGTSAQGPHTGGFRCPGSCLSPLTSGLKDKQYCVLTKKNYLLFTPPLIYTGASTRWCAQASTEELVETMFIAGPTHYHPKVQITQMFIIS